MRARESLFQLLFTVTVVGLLLLSLGPVSSVFSSNKEFPPFLFTSTARYDGLAWLHGGDRFNSQATLFLQDGKQSRKLVPSFAASADPATSFDGRRVLFSGKQTAGAHWQIWEIELPLGRNSEPAAGTLRQLTSCADDCIRPFYLPDDRFVYARKVGREFVIEADDLVENKGGKSIVRLTYGPGNALPADVLRDGRILFEATYPLGSNHAPELYTVYSDGSGVESYRCDHGNGRHAARQSASGDIIFASEFGLGRFTSAHAKEMHIAAPPGDYAGELAETSSDEWFLAWRRTHSDYFQIRRWKPGDRATLPLVAQQSADVIQPTLIVERVTPNRHPSGLHDSRNANLLCLNAYTSKYGFALHSIRSVRFYTQSNTGTATLLGTAPVESDGSFFVQVPSEQPLQVELLDASGRTLKREAGWFWMRRGEQRACVGCHAGPETAPENAVPKTLLKSTTPADLTSASTNPSSGGH